MSNQDNKSNNSNMDASKDKGKAKSISSTLNNTSNLLREALNPSNGTSTASALNSLLRQNNHQKLQSSSSTTLLQQGEWQHNVFHSQDDVNNTKNDYTNIHSQVNDSGGLDTEWKQWNLDPCPSARSINSSHIYPFHHHNPHKTNYQDENEILEFLNSNNYTEQIYHEDLSQLTSNRQKDYNFLENCREEYQESILKDNVNSKFIEEFLESKDIHEYLSKISYTDDIYGIPTFLKELINEAKNELNNDDDNDKNLKHQITAIERLKMDEEISVELTFYER
ncbi:137_t:CDS:2 [Funneliformis geosporum]|uniref:137_t:CDS:1 n=1 Tax=Funneliformis geosporum TaxID=1117311 RepID=A0A9W4SH80_9GLOM|nr:137_t:CDS:2 [Funneliformis geosporum]